MPKKIIFCADGTWDHPGRTDSGLEADTNVYKFYKALPQLATQEPHYDDGVGADGGPIDRLLGGAIGEGLFAKVKAGYTTIARSYDDGDSVYVFGFSRGAYTARSLAGMLAICGLPDEDKFTDQATKDAFEAYRAGSTRQPLLDSFVARYGRRNVKIDMLGVWDTVGALGIPGDVFVGLDTKIYGFLDTGLHPDVQTAYHAVSIDERRREFVPTLWTSFMPNQHVEQVWFAGVHCDVGGGYADSGLADIMLGWMMAKAAQNGLTFDSSVLSRYSPSAAKHSLDVIHESWSPLWGFPRSRQISSPACFSNSVGIRREQLPTYRPANLPGTFPHDGNGFSTEPVVLDPPDP